MERLKELLGYIKEMDILDILDIALVWLMLYLVYKFIRERRATKLAFGVILLFALRFVSDFFNLIVMEFLLQNVLQVGLIALVVVFQPELRSALEKVGGEPLRSIKSLTDSKAVAEYNDVIANICEAVCGMGLDRTGALVVIGRHTDLSSYVKSGTELNANVKSFLLKNIFFDKAPMHDGAVIIRNTRVLAAGCFLPLSTNPDIVKELGTRHRAAIGLSEETDALVIVVSEETGIVSVARDGKLTRNLDYGKLQKILNEEMVTRSESVRKHPVAAFIQRVKRRYRNEQEPEEGEDEV
ncbi:MAG: diadenylate cyclase CdaA [Clostridia bacterium]|nr:diadenylate cyclase CdaA [Clostridia bacterium]